MLVFVLTTTQVGVIAGLTSNVSFDGEDTADDAAVCFDSRGPHLVVLGSVHACRSYVEGTGVPVVQWGRCDGMPGAICIFFTPRCASNAALGYDVTAYPTFGHKGYMTIASMVAYKVHKL